MRALISDEKRADFQRDGFILFPDFYDLETEIYPIMKGVYELIGLLIEKHALDIPRPGFTPENFDSGYQQMIAMNRSVGGELYDALKHLPALVRLLSSEKNEALFKALRETDFPAIATRGHGIRIDNPGEEKFNSPWHQEFPTHLRSIDGLVFWTSLIDMSEELGPVRLRTGSHKEGARKLTMGDENDPFRDRSYGLSLRNEEQILAEYEEARPLAKVGDLVVIDYLTIHASSPNRAQRSRWSIQMRLFNYRNEDAVKNSWRGAFPPGEYIPVVDALKVMRPDLLEE